MYEKMRVRGALIGVESFTEQGLKDANKTWNPVGERMVEAIQKIQSHGIFVLASIINGLESDTVETLQTMREFAIAFGHGVRSVSDLQRLSGDQGLSRDGP